MNSETEFIIDVYVRPGARSDSVGGAFDGRLAVKVKAPADRGKANRAVTKAVAKAFGLRPSAVEVIRGTKSRRKRLGLDLSGLDAPDSHRLMTERLTDLMT